MIPKYPSIALLSLIIAIATSYFINRSSGEPNEKSADEIVKSDGRKAQNEDHWYNRYTKDHCDRCPECCVHIKADGFIDEYGVTRPLDWLPDNGENENHCSDCPGASCQCIKTTEGAWVLSPETAE